MKSQIEISSRAARPTICVLSVLLFLAAACSGGRSALSTEPLGASTNGASSSDKSDLPACGSMTKPCNPMNLGGQTCSMMGMGSGTLMCDPVTCSFDTSNCTLSGNTGSGGLGALLGAFGRNQGGRAAMGQGGASARGGRGAVSNAGRGGSRGQREDGQDAEEGGRGGQGADDDEDDDDEEAGRGGEGGSSGEGGSAGESGSSGEAGSSGEGGASGETPDAGSATAGTGGEASPSGEAGSSGASGEAADAAVPAM